MKKMIFSLILNVSILSLLAQAPFPTARDVELFMNSKTLVVLEDGIFSAYNIDIKKAVEQHWEITDYEFISTEDFNQKRYDSAYSFLVLIQTSFERDKKNVYYNFLNLILGKTVKTIAEMPEFCSIPLSYSEGDEMIYIYKLGLMIRFIQEHVQLIANDPTVTSLRDLKYYNKNAPEVKNKVILVTEDGLSPEVNTISKIKNSYPYEIQIVSHEDIKNAILKKQPNTVILHIVGPEEGSKTGRSYKILFGIDDAKIYFFNFHVITPKRPDGFLQRDFKRLARY
jgi:hypothetical protein